MNLLKETINVLRQYGKDPDEVIWAGSADGRYAISWDKFYAMADIEYNNDFGSQKIAKDLVIVGKGFWLERGEYDGSEWWDYKEAPERRFDTQEFSTVMNGDRWATIEEMNRPGGKYAEDE